MNLDDLSNIAQIDSQDMLREINELPQQLTAAWELGSTMSLPQQKQFSRVIISGMGGSAIGADLLRSYVLDSCPVPVMVYRDYGLPKFAFGADTLFIASSHSGNTEETIDAFKTARKAGCTCMVISTGGKLCDMANEAGLPAWKFEHKGQPRAAVGYSFGLLLTLFCRLGLIEDQKAMIDDAVENMKKTSFQFQPQVPAVNNAAKRYAGQLVGRWVTILGSGILSVVAARWKGQINELAEAPANAEALPEADHNTLAGITNPSESLLSPKTFSIFLSTKFDHPRNILRGELTRNIFMVEGLNTDVYTAVGETPLAQMWSAIHFGDYLAYYLSIAYETDPTPIAALLSLKKTLTERQ